MAEDALLDRYRTASRRALVVTVLVLVALGCSLFWYGSRLDELEAGIAELKTEREALEQDRTLLTEELRALTDAPDGGVRAVVTRVKQVAKEMYDFALWVDTSYLSKEVEEVRYEFDSGEYSPITSRLAEAGFAAYFRGPVRPEQPVCPGRSMVTITFGDASTKAIDYDLCAAIPRADPS